MTNNPWHDSWYRAEGLTVDEARRWQAIARRYRFGVPPLEEFGPGGHRPRPRAHLDAMGRSRTAKET